MKHPETQPARPPAPPLVLSTILCEAIWKDSTTGKHTLLGVFNQVASFEYPFQLPQLTIYLALTAVRGRTRVEVRVIDDGEIHPAIFIGDGVIDAASPLDVIDATWCAPRVTFGAAGDYRLQISVNGQTLAERKLSVIQLPLANHDA